MRKENPSSKIDNGNHILDWTAAMSATRQGEEGVSEAQVPNKGILFENLVEQLLTAMFPMESWRRTQQSHDKKRDFVFPAEEYLPEKKWAECKNFSKSLSINVIAPTLIMAAIEKIDSILFFSYSELNENALRNLIQYSKLKKMEIKVFDGNLLDALICRYCDIPSISALFPNADFKKAQEQLNKRAVRIVRTIRDTNGQQLPHDHAFALGEQFYISVILQNLSDHHLKGGLCSDSNQPGKLTCAEKSAGVSLPVDSTEEFSFLWEPLQLGNATINTKIFLNNQAEQLPEVKTDITITGESYLFWAGENALNARRQALEHLKARKPAPLLIVGKGGVGKTTLLQILLRDNEVFAQYTILRMDLDHSNSAESLFSQIIGVRTTEQISDEQKADMDAAISVLTSNYAYSTEKMAETLLNLYDSNRPYLIVLDDVQKLKGSNLVFILELVEIAKKRELPIYFLFALNTENYSVESLLLDLNWDSMYQNKNCVKVNLTLFGRKDISAYLNTAYGIADASYGLDNCMASEDRVHPLDLYIFCKGLQEERVIRPIPGGKSFQIVDAFRFRQKFLQLLSSGISLKEICDAVDKGKISEDILRYIFIAGNTSGKIGRRFPRQLKALAAHGIIKESDGKIILSHDSIRAAVKENFKFSDQNYAEIFADPDTNNTAKAICVLTAVGRIEDGDKYLHGFFSSTVCVESAEQRYQLCSLIFQQLSYLSANGLGAKALSFAQAQFNILRTDYGYAALFPLLKQIVASGLSGAWDTDCKSVECMAFFIKKYFDRALSNYDYQECNTYFQEYRKLFSRLKHISESRRYFWLCHYANRAAIALDRASNPLGEEPEDVRCLYELSEEYRRKADAHDELSLQITVDNFYRHYVYRQDLSATTICDTYSRLLQIDERKVSESMVLTYHLLLLDALRLVKEGERTSLAGFSEKICETRQQCANVFYTVKLYMLSVIVLLRLRQYKDAEELLSEATQYAYKKDMRTYVYKFTYVKTQILFLQNGRKVSEEIYEQAVLALRQMFNARQEKDLMREAFLLTGLVDLIKEYPHGTLPEILSGDVVPVPLLNALSQYRGEQSSCLTPPLSGKGYFYFDGISYPNV